VANRLESLRIFRAESLCAAARWLDAWTAIVDNSDLGGGGAEGSACRWVSAAGGDGTPMIEVKVWWLSGFVAAGHRGGRGGDQWRGSCLGRRVRLEGWSCGGRRRV
jgi:hypothetical protein